MLKPAAVQSSHISGRVRLSAKLVVLDSDGTIVVTRRNADEEFNPNKLGAIGGNFDTARAEGTTAEICVNEASEEINRTINPDDLIHLHDVRELKSRGPRDVHYLFWQNRGLPLDGCAEGTIERFDSASDLMMHSDIGPNLRRALKIARNRGLIPA